MNIYKQMRPLIILLLLVFSVLLVSAGGAAEIHFGHLAALEEHTAAPGAFKTSNLTEWETVPSQERRLDYTIEQFSEGTWYTGIYLADMDYDGHPEVLIGNRDTSSLEIWRYDSNADSLMQIDNIEFSYHIHDMKAADFDKDGDMDIAVGLRFDGLQYATNTGAPGTVGSWDVREIDGLYSWQVLVDDFDRDSNLDVFNGVDYGPINTWYGDGAGNFVRGAVVQDTTTEMRFPRSFNAVDLNGDKRLDLIGVDGSFMRAFLNPGNRTGNWTSTGPSTPLGDYPCCGSKLILADASPSAGDLDGNGVIDQVTQMQRRPSGTVDLLIFEGSVSGGDLSWTPRILDSVAGIGWAGHAGVADLDGDGHLDVHFGGADKFNGLRAYLGDGSGGFTPEIVTLDHGVGGMNSFAVGDLNGDGGPDIVTTRYTSGKGEFSGFEVLFMAGCKTLTLSHTGEGSDPAPSPANSPGCPAGSYNANQLITLSAAPKLGFQVYQWSGTDKDRGKSAINRVTMPAHDHTVKVVYGPILEILPFVVYDCYAGDEEVEPNNDLTQASVPLCGGTRTIHGLPNDQWDYFMFHTRQVGDVSIEVTNHHGEGTQVALYYLVEKVPQLFIDHRNSKDGLQVEYKQAPPGRYYIVIYTETPKPQETRPYTMQVEIP